MTDRLKDQFLEMKKLRVQEAHAHELGRSWEMAYISYWSILEEGLKLFASTAVKRKLHGNIKEWDKFLSSSISKRPKKIRNFETEYKSDKIPQIELIELVLGQMPLVKKIIEPKKKWRNRRTDIAHKAQKFINEQKFLEYKADILSSIEQLTENITHQST